MSSTITENDITGYLYTFLEHEKVYFKDHYKLNKKYCIELNNNKYIFQGRKELIRLKRLRTKDFEIEKLSKFIKKNIVGDYQFYNGYFLTDFFKSSMKNRNVNDFEWEEDNNMYKLLKITHWKVSNNNHFSKLLNNYFYLRFTKPKTPNYSLDLLIKIIIITKQLLNEYEKGIVFAKDKDKNTFRKYFKNIDNLTNTQKEKLKKYAILENRQELLSYIKNENIINRLDIQKEYNHLNNISLIPNKQKIIRSFKYYLHNLFNDKSLMKEDVTKKRNVDKLFRDIIEHYFDTDRNFIEYYSLDDREDYKKLKKIRQSHTKQSFNFHDIKFSNFS